MKRFLFKWCLTIGFALVLSFFSSFAALACTTPVFRYALEMWPAFNYRVVVVHDGNLNSDQILALEQLKKSTDGKNSINLTVNENSKDEYFSLNNEMPEILLFNPVENKNKDIIWKGELTAENVEKIVNSPARRQIVKNIMNGDAVTWIFVNSNDKKKDNPASAILHESLEKLSGSLKLAKDATDIEGNLLDIRVIERGVHFSMVSISRDDPREEVFLKILLSTEPDLPFIKAPLAFPVFGRGRILYALAGKGINEKLIESACQSVIGWCSCTVKEDNPGSDLLIRADWDKAIGDSSWIKVNKLPEITGISGFQAHSGIKDKSKISDPRKNLTTVKAEKIKESGQLSKNLKIQPSEIKKDETNDMKNKVTVPGYDTSGLNRENRNPVTRNIMTVAAFIFIAATIISFYLIKRRGDK